MERGLGPRVRTGAALAVLVMIAAACQAPTAPEASPSTLAGNPLQPLAADLTWTYRATTADPTDPNAIAGLVTAVVGSETVGGETAWLIENYPGTTYASRLVAVERGGDLWVVAIDSIVDGAWKRTTLPTAQLYQPAPGVRTWTSDFGSGPEVWQFTADWSQRASGEMLVLGESRRIWLVEGNLAFAGGGAKIREVDTFAEGVGLVSLSDFSEGGPLRFDLVTMGVGRPALVGRWAGALKGSDLTLDLTGAGATITVGDGASSPVQRWHAADPDVTFSFGDAPVYDAALRLAPWGLVGTATGPDGRALALEFHPDLRTGGAPATPVPSAGG